MGERFDEKALRGWLDRQSIRNVLATHSRGIDRCDAALLKTAYHADAEVAYGFFNGPADKFCDVVTEGTRPLPVTLHRTHNMWVQLRDDGRAVSESYVIAYMHVPGDAKGTQSLIGGRYLDRHECRDEAWKLSHRSYVLDWNVNQPGSGSADPAYAAIFTTGGKHPDDPGQKLLADWTNPASEKTETRSGTMQIQGPLAAKIEAALAQQDIHDLIMAQARATDRGDAALLGSLWHPGATVDIGPFPKDAREFSKTLLEAVADRDTMFHSVANEWIKVTGDTAAAESYVIAFTKVPEDGGHTDEITGGRYLDRFAHRDGHWKFVHRTFIADWQIRQASTDQSGEGLYAALTTHGSRSKDDPVYAFWGG